VIKQNRTIARFNDKRLGNLQPTKSSIAQIKLAIHHIHHTIIKDHQTRKIEISKQPMFSLVMIQSATVTMDSSANFCVNC